MVNQLNDMVKGTSGRIVNETYTRPARRTLGLNGDLNVSTGLGFFFILNSRGLTICGVKKLKYPRFSFFFQRTLV